MTVSGISISGTDAANYTVNTTATATASITQKALTVTATGINQVYDGTTTASVTLADNRVNGDLMIVVNSTASFADKNVGTGKTVSVAGISISGTDATNYTVNTTTTATANITQRALTVTATGINRVYDGTTTAYVTLADNRVNGDVLTASNTLATFVDKNVATGKTVTVSDITISGTDAANYTVNTTTTTTANITQKALTVTATASDKVYDGTTTASVTLADNRVNGDVLAAANTTATFSDKNVDTSKTVTVAGISISGTDAGNYTVNTTTTTTANITQRSLTVTATGINQVYDGTTTASVTLADNRVNGDVLTAADTSATFIDKNVGTGKTVSVAGISISGTDAANYTVNTITSTMANITSKSLTIIGLSGTDKTYDGTTSASITGTASFSGLVTNDVVTLTAGTASFADANVGTAKTVTFSGYSISGADAGNYMLSQPADSAASISVAALTITATNQTKTYGDNNSLGTTGFSTSALYGVDSVTSVSLSTNASTSTSGQYNAGAWTLTPSAPQGSGLTNYSITYTASILTVNTAALAISGLSGTDKTYDGTTSDSVTGTASFGGLVTNDVVTLTAGAGTASFADANVGTGKTVTFSGYSISGADAGNYTVSQPADSAASITAAALTITATNQTKTYGDSNSLGTTGFITSMLSGTDAVTGVTLATNASTSTSGQYNAGTWTLTPSVAQGSGLSNYNISYSSGSLTVNQAALTISGLSGTDKTYDGTTRASVTGTSSLNGVVTSDVVSLMAGTASFADANVGTGKTVTFSRYSISGADAGNYTVSQPDNSTASISAAALTITATNQTKTYGDSNSLGTNGFSTSALYGVDSVTSVSLSTNAGTSTSGKYNAGTWTLTPSAALGSGLANYSISYANAITGLTVVPRSLSVVATGVTKVYDGTVAATVNLADNRLAADVLTTTYTNATFADKNAARNKAVSVSGISLTGTDAANYTLNTTTATATATISAKALVGSVTVANKVFDGNTYGTITARTLTGVVPGDVVNYLSNTGYEKASFSDKHVGAAKIATALSLYISGADAANYTVNSTATTTATISQFALTVTATGPRRVYDGTTAAIATLAANTVPGSTFSATYASATFADKNVSVNKPVSVSGIALGGPDAGDYTFNTTATTTGTITTRALVLAATGIDKVYDGTKVASVNLSDNRMAGDILAPVYSASFADKNVGTATKAITVTVTSLGGPDGGNYSFNNIMTTSANITKASLTVTATGVNKVYDGTVTAGATLLDNRMTGDSLTVVRTGATFSNKNVGTAKAVTVAGISVSGTDAGNYTLANTTTTTTANITPLTITTSVTPNSKVYDGATAATLASRSLIGVIGSDAVTLTGGTATFSDKNAGTSKTVTVTGLSLTGTDASNYTVSSTATTTAGTITKATLTVTATGVNKVYDRTTTTSVTLADNRIANDVLTVAYSTATFADKNVATGKTVTVTGLSATGTDAVNYTVSPTTITTTANITPLAITGAITASNKVYDATTTAAIATRTLTGIISGDNVTYTGGTATFIDKNTGTGKTVTATGLSLTGGDALNYTVNNSATTTAAITPRSLNPVITANSRVYDGTNIATLKLADNRIAGDVLTPMASSATFPDRNVGTNKTVTIIGAAVAGPDAGNYSYTAFPASFTSTATITTKAIVGTVTVADKVFDGNAFGIITARTLSGVAPGDVVNYFSNTGYEKASFSDKNVGNAKAVTALSLYLSGADAANYTVNSTATTTASITPFALTVTAASGTTQVYNGATATTVNLSSNTVVGSTISLSYTAANFADKNVGTNKVISVSGISISGSDATNYTFNTTASAIGTITPRVLTFTATGVNKVYDGTRVATVTLLDNRVVGDVLAPAYAATFTDKNVGSSKTVTVTGLSVSGTDAANYTVSPTTLTTSANITPRDLTVTATGVNKVYDATTTASVTLADNRVTGDQMTVTYSTASFADKNVDTAKAVTVSGISISGTDATNYSVAPAIRSAITTTANITPLAITGSFTATNKVYDGTTSASIATRSPVGVLTGDSVTLTDGTATFSDKNTGTAKTVTAVGLSMSGTDASNYTLPSTTTTTTANITPRTLIVTATGISRVYDGTTTASVTLADNRVNGDLLIVVNSTATFADKNVGIAKTVTVTGLSVSGADAANYTVIPTTTTTTANITPRVLAVTATGVNKVYNGTTAAIVTLADNRVIGDQLIDANTIATFSDKNVGTGKAVTVTGINISGADAANYTVNTSANTTASVTRATLAVTATGVNKVYDRTAAASVTLADNRVTGDVLTLAYSTAAFVDKNVGTTKSVTVTGLSASGTDAGNYTVIPTTTTTTANITPLAITGAITASSKVYDATTTAAIATRTLTGVISGDTVTYTGGTATFSDKNAGTGKTVSATGLSLAGTDAANYTVNSTASTMAAISQRSLNPTITANGRVYDGTTQATLTLTDNRIAGDVLTPAATSANFADKNVGTNKVVTIIGATLTGADAGNYSYTAFPSSFTTTASITARALVGTVTVANKVFDGNAYGTITARTLTGVVPGDVVSYLSNTGYEKASFVDKHVGTAKTATALSLYLSGADAANYTVNSVATTTSTISPFALTVTATGTKRVYDGTTAATVTLAANPVAGSTLTLSYASANFADKNVGVNKAVNVTGIQLSGADALDYTFNSTASTIGTITPRTLVFTATAASKKYDGNTKATITSLLDNRVTGDSITLSYAAAMFDTAAIGTAKKVTIGVITVTGTDAANYSVPSYAYTTADIIA